MSQPNSHPSEPTSNEVAASNEKLIAYLDGELSREQSESVEREIQDNNKLRHDMQQYDRVWNVLDRLPQATVGDSFTMTTIEMVAYEAKKNLAEQTALLPVRKRNRRWQLAGIGLLGVAAGILLMLSLMPNPNRTLFTHLPVVTQLDAYNEVRDIEFLRLLHEKEGTWLQREWGPQADLQAETLAQITLASYTKRQQYVEQLSDKDREDLANKLRRYSGMTEAMREELQRRHNTMATAPDAAELQQTMLAYYAWVTQFTELDQAKLRQLSSEKRVEKVRQMQHRIARSSAMRLTKENSLALREAFEALADSPEIVALHKKFIAKLPKSTKPTTKSTTRPSANGKSATAQGPNRNQQRMLAILRQSDTRRTNGLVLWLAVRGEVPLEGYEPYREAIERHLLEAIDPATADRLRKMKVRDRSRILSIWLVDSRRRKKPDVAALEAFFTSGKIAPNKQQELLSMPKEQMLRELEQLYIEEFLGDKSLGNDIRRDFRSMLGHGRGGRPGGPPPLGGNGRGRSAQPSPPR